MAPSAVGRARGVPGWRPGSVLVGAGVGGPEPGGSGLLGLVADRFAVLDGQLRVESPVDGGTLVAADIPLPNGGR
jgi:hypothetical protein